MQGLDFAVLFGYMAGLVILGMLLSRKIKNSEDMFAAGGQSPWWMAGISGYMAMFTSGTFVVWGGIAFKQGFVGITILLMLGISACLVGFLLAKKWKLSGCATPAEYIELRLGKGAVQFYSWLAMTFRMIGIGVALYAISVILSSLIPLPEGSFFMNPQSGTLSVSSAVILCGSVITIAAAAGGLWAVLMADVVQFVVLMTSVIIVVPLIIKEVGGFGAFVSKAPKGFFLPYSSEFPVVFLAGWIIIHFFKIGGEWAFVQRFLCVPNERQSQKSAYIFGVLFLISPFLWMLPPMVYRVIDPAANPEKAYILACQKVLPPGMIGFIMASMFAATASTVNAEINVFAGAFTREIYGRLFRPDSTEKHLVFMGRIFTLLLGALAIGIALTVPFIGGAEDIVLKLTGMMVTPMVLPAIWGLFSKRIGQSSVWVTFGVSLIGIFIIKFLLRDVSWFIEKNRIVETCIIGIIIPLVTLSILEFSARRESNGFYAVQAKSNSTAGRRSTQKASRLPQIILGVYMIVVAAAILIISMLSEQGRSLLRISSFVLGLLGIMILLLTKSFSTSSKRIFM